MYDRAAIHCFRYLPTILSREWFHGASEELHTSQPNPTIQVTQFRRNASVGPFRQMKHRHIRAANVRIGFAILIRFLLQRLGVRNLNSTEVHLGHTPRFHRRQLQPFYLPIRNLYSLARDKTLARSSASSFFTDVSLNA